MTAHTLTKNASETLPREDRMERTAALFAALTECTPAEHGMIVEEIILLNRCVADSIASRYAERGIALDDLRQTAYEGLTKAVLRFDPSQGRDLLSFAVPTIRGELRRYFRDHGWTVRPPRGLQELQPRLRRASAELAHDLGREPEVEELAAHLEVDVDECRAALATDGCFQPTSLDRPASADGERTIGDLLRADGSDLEAADARLLLAPVIKQLSERERTILQLRFYDGLTQAEIGERLGVTQMQVSRLLSTIFKKMRLGIGPIDSDDESSRRGRIGQLPAA